MTVCVGFIGVRFLESKKIENPVNVRAVGMLVRKKIKIVENICSWNDDLSETVFSQLGTVIVCFMAFMARQWLTISILLIAIVYQDDF